MKTIFIISILFFSIISTSFSQDTIYTNYVYEHNNILIYGTYSISTYSKNVRWIFYHTCIDCTDHSVDRSEFGPYDEGLIFGYYRKVVIKDTCDMNLKVTIYSGLDMQGIEYIIKGNGSFCGIENERDLSNSLGISLEYLSDFFWCDKNEKNFSASFVFVKFRSTENNYRIYLLKN